MPVNYQIIDAFQAHQLLKASDLLSYLRFRSLRAAGHPLATTIDLDESENNAIFGTGEILLGDDSEHKQAVLSGWMSNQGDYQGVPCTFSYCILDKLILIFSLRYSSS